MKKCLCISLSLVILLVFSGCKEDNSLNNDLNILDGSDIPVALNSIDEVSASLDNDAKTFQENSEADISKINSSDNSSNETNSSIDTNSSTTKGNYPVIVDNFPDIDTPYEMIKFASNIYIGEVLEVSKTPLPIEKNESKYNSLNEIDKSVFDDYYMLKKEALIRVKVKEVFKGNYKADTIVNDRIRFEFVDLLENGKIYLFMTGVDYYDSELLWANFYGTPAYNAMIINPDNSLSFLEPWDEFNYDKNTKSGIPLSVGYFKGVFSPLTALSENLLNMIENNDFEIKCRSDTHPYISWVITSCEKFKICRLYENDKLIYVYMRTPEMVDEKDPNENKIGIYELDENMNLIREISENDHFDKNSKYYKYNVSMFNIYNNAIRGILIHPSLAPTYLDCYADNSYLESDNVREFGPLSLYFEDNRLTMIFYNEDNANFPKNEKCVVEYLKIGSDFDTKSAKNDVAKIKQQLGWVDTVS